MMIGAAYALLVEEQTAQGASLKDAVTGVEEMLMPIEQARAAQNRRRFGHLLAQAERAK